jgi:tRNA pseudouridine38-40 synthase
VPDVRRGIHRRKTRFSSNLTTSSGRATRRIRFTVTYDGTDFHGWQVQPELPTIQGTLEGVVSQIEGRPVRVEGSGRTDAGVHARAQVAAISLANPIPPDNLRRAINRLLPPAIRVGDVEEVHAEFHPRFDAVAKTYEYRIFRAEVCDPFQFRYVHHHPYPLDLARMRDLAAGLEGERDFASFAASDPSDAEGRSKVRRIFSSVIEDRGDLWVYRVRGSGFLKHMVRNMVGYLIEGGKGNRPQAGGPTVPAKGLTLWSVEYGSATLKP